MVVLWFAVFGFINFLYLWIYSELQISSFCGWFVMHGDFHATGIFHFVAIYGVLSDVTGWNTEELTNLLFCLISNLSLQSNQNPYLLCDSAKPYNWHSVKMSRTFASVWLQLLQFPRSG
jgi:hypothetical protein